MRVIFDLSQLKGLGQVQTVEAAFPVGDTEIPISVSLMRLGGSQVGVSINRLYKDDA